MAFYQVLLREGLSGGIEVSSEGRIVSATYPVLYKAIGLRFIRFSAWVKRKGGEIYPVKERPFESELRSS
jgi:hypothetical protein